MTRLWAWCGNQRLWLVLGYQFKAWYAHPSEYSLSSSVSLRPAIFPLWTCRCLVTGRQTYKGNNRQDRTRWSASEWNVPATILDSTCSYIFLTGIQLGPPWIIVVYWCFTVSIRCTKFLCTDFFHWNYLFSIFFLSTSPFQQCIGRGSFYK